MKAKLVSMFFGASIEPVNGVEKSTKQITEGAQLVETT
jgi:hypothetical protein